LNVLVTVSSAAIWIAAVLFHRTFLPWLSYAPGIDVVFIPAGVRLVLLMIGGFYAAVGVGLGSLPFLQPEFGVADAGDIAALTFSSGFFPYVALLATQRLLGISSNLENIRPLHLPLIALGVAVGSSLLHNLLFAALGLQQWSQLPEHSIAMVTGDFTGSLVAVIVAYAIVRLRRRLKR